MMDSHTIPGWYGKLPSLGDFASRRLNPDFIEDWDVWLATGLGDWREREPTTWLEHYLSGPSWRFVLMPGVLTGQLAHAQTAWAGVLMPSVDKVGRYFPLTIAQPLSSLALNAAQTRALLAWLQQVDDAALDALQDDWSIDQLDAELQRVGIWRPDMPVVEDSAQQEAGPLDILTHMARDGLLSQLQGHALWLYPEPLGSLRLQISWGLPQGQAFSDLMTGTALPASLPVSHQIV